MGGNQDGLESRVNLPFSNNVRGLSDVGSTGVQQYANQRPPRLCWVVQNVVVSDGVTLTIRVRLDGALFSHQSDEYNILPHYPSEAARKKEKKRLHYHRNRMISSFIFFLLFIFVAESW